MSQQNIPASPSDDNQSQSNLAADPALMSLPQSVPDPSANATATQQDSPKPHQVAVPDIAADADLIEKEWVDRAKQIVDHTRDNPYEQQKAIAKMKVEYMKKRYDREIKAPEA